MKFYWLDVFPEPIELCVASRSADPFVKITLVSVHLDNAVMFVRELDLLQSSCFLGKARLHLTNLMRQYRILQRYVRSQFTRTSKKRVPKNLYQFQTCDFRLNFRKLR